MMVNCCVIDWFAGGKGPDPEKAALDREMEDYFKAKGAAAMDETVQTT